MARNKKYDYLAEFVHQYISDIDLMRLTKKFENEKDPKKIIATLKEELENKWEQNADMSPRMGNPFTQRKNFKKFLDKELLTLNKTIFKKPMAGQQAGLADFNPLFAKYRELTGEIMKEIPEVAPRVKKAIEEGKGEPKVLFNRLKRQIEISAKADHPQNILAVYKATERWALQSKKGIEGQKKISKMMPIEQLYELRQTAGKALEPYMIKEPELAMKSEAKLRKSLEFEGVDTSLLETKKQLQSAAKKANIGLRNWQRNKNELINEITKLTGYEKEDLQSEDLTHLKYKFKNILKVKPKEKFHINFDNLPTATEKIQSMYDEHGEVIPEEEKKQARKDLKTKYPFFTPQQITKEVNKKMAAKLLKFPVYGDELESRYMEREYKDPTRKPSFFDLMQISKMSEKKANAQLGVKMVEKKDPITGKVKEVRYPLPIEHFKEYRSNLRRELKAQKDIIFNRVDVLYVPPKHEKRFLKVGGKITKPIPQVYEPEEVGKGKALKPEILFGL